MIATTSRITNSSQAHAATQKQQKNYFSKSANRLARTGRAAMFLLVAIPAILIFTQKQAYAQ
ncbi:MAG TPA: hypothetical protein PLO51_01150, partial [Candidatus Micrarchaeota archaeon]|nr:hypothetical protein [Candidatus Micrarchaeota archaeon]